MGFTAAQARQLLQQAGAAIPPDLAETKVEKVRNSRRKTIDGIPFRSTLEARCYLLFRSWQATGAISELECQPRFVLQDRHQVKGRMLRKIEYVADFQFLRDGKHVVVDAKGYRMEVYRIKAKLFQVKYPEIQFEEWNLKKLKENGG